MYIVHCTVKWLTFMMPCLGLHGAVCFTVAMYSPELELYFNPVAMSWSARRCIFVGTSSHSCLATSLRMWPEEVPIDSILRAPRPGRSLHFFCILYFWRALRHTLVFGKMPWCYEEGYDRTCEECGGNYMAALVRVPWGTAILRMLRGLWHT